MSKKRKIVSPMEHLYSRSSEYTLQSGRIIYQGEIIKIDGVWGVSFKFKEHIVRTDSGKEWIDCYELEKGITCGLRSFYPEKIKPLSKKRNKKKTV